MDELSPGLQPLLLWMANSIELLRFVQHDVPQLLPWRREHDLTGGPAGRRPSEQNSERLFHICCDLYFIYLFPPPGLPDEEVSSTRAACEEAMTVLEEVIMFTFQQSVYYLTKVRLVCRKRDCANSQPAPFCRQKTTAVGWKRATGAQEKLQSREQDRATLPLGSSR